MGDVKAIQTLMRHATADLLIGRYWHQMETEAAETVNRMAAAAAATARARRPIATSRRVRMRWPHPLPRQRLRPITPDAVSEPPDSLAFCCKFQGRCQWTGPPAVKIPPPPHADGTGTEPM